MKYLIEIKADHPQDLGGDAKAAIVARLEQVMDDGGFDQIDTVLNGQGGQQTEGTIYRMSMGSIALGPNGLVVKSTQHDPAEVRLGAPLGQLTVGKLSGDIIRADGVHEEVGFLMFKRDERRRHDPNDKTGLVEIWVRDGRAGGSDDQQFSCAIAFAFDGIHVYKPVFTYF